MAAAEAELDDAPNLWEGKYNTALASAYKIDSRLAPRTVGNFGRNGMAYGGYSGMLSYALVRRRYYDSRALGTFKDEN